MNKNLKMILFGLSLIFLFSSVASAANVTANFTANTTTGDVPLTVDFTDQSVNATTWAWDFGDGNTAIGQNQTHTYTSAGNYTVSLFAENGTDNDTETKADFIQVNAAAVLPNADFSANTTSGEVPLTVQFTDGSTNATSWEWDVNNDGTVDYTIQNPVHTYSSTGSFTVSFAAINANGTAYENKTDYITVNASSSNPPIASFDTNVTEGSAPLTVQFNDTSSDSDSLSWDFGDGETSTDQNPVHTYDSTGTYNVTLTATNGDGDDTASTTITVQPENYYSGDRIWDENAGQSTTYTWNAKSFSGFFYELDSGFSSETMKITDISDSIGDRKLEYRTESVESSFERSEWGKYEVIGFMAEKYFAAYTSETKIDNVDSVSLISSGQLSKVLIDDDDKRSVYTGSSLILKEGYRLNIVQVDRNGDKVMVTLTQDSDEVDTAIISGSGDYIYEKNLGDSDDVPIIAVHFDSIFSGTESNAVFVQGIFQISEDYIEIEDGETFGKMKVTGFGNDYIEMKNDGRITLSPGKTIDIMGKINFIVADSSTLRFAPFVDMSDPGTYELRGTVAEGSEELTWTPLNFEGFYYDIDEGIRTETLELKSIDDRKIPKDGLVYTSTPREVSFEHSPWNNFNVIGFMAKKYFAGYPENAFGSSSSVDILSDGLLSEVLIDEDDKRSVYSGQSLILEEGYVLDIVEVDRDGNQVLIEISKDGDRLESDVVSAGRTYIYEKDLGNSDDVPIIAVHFDEIFRGSESNAVFIQGIFQISEDYVELESGETFSKMEVTSTSGSITMKNKDSISLSRGKSVALMGDISFNVADDSNTVRYYPYVEVTTAPSQTLRVDLDRSVVAKGDDVVIKVSSRGASVSEATVNVEGISIGKTDDEGRATYTASKIGTLEIVAEKSGYASGSDELEVISPDDETKKMIIEVSPDDVYEGTSATIFVLKAIGGDAIEGAEVTLDGKSIGSTSRDGTITYTMTEAGMHKLKAEKSGLLEAELDLEVQELAAKFEFSNLRIDPLDVKEGKETTISVDVTNTGTAAGEYTVDLRVDDTVVDSQAVSLDVDETRTIVFKHTEEEPGVYSLDIGGLNKEYEVFESSGTIWYILGAIVVIGAGGLGYLFTAGGWTVEIAHAKVDESIQAIQELVGNLR
ncbi:S-layer protein domain-containing protein [Methanolobus halotolerans]|uniref:S-layer protein n=1 Tax=Methanolobus halotolerans TaxID=2052935 RepID=A0A4E0QT18_9EURY|nr:S-layer protein domain-containing protein [Methanolobus halotolerans]TGC10941.1 S-layer protein [Methanolobus halotolerans]